MAQFDGELSGSLLPAKDGGHHGAIGVEELALSDTMLRLATTILFYELITVNSPLKP